MLDAALADLELFARKQRPGWVTWGDEVPKAEGRMTAWVSYASTDMRMRMRIARVLAGETVVANVGKRKPDALKEWAEQRGLLVYIGNKGQRHQWPQSIWGNLFKISKHGEPDRDQVIAAYRERLEHSPDVVRRLPELRGKVLGCWCYPLSCHGDVLCEAVG